MNAVTVDARATHPAVADDAAAAVTAAATAAVHRPERRDALGATLAALRAHVGGDGRGDANGRGARRRRMRERRAGVAIQLASTLRRR